MEASVRPWFTAGVALVGAGAVAMAPITPTPPAVNVHVPAVAAAPQFQLSALEIPYILTLPVVRQSIRNWGENWVVYLGGFAQSGVGLVQSLLAIPGVTIEIIQQVFDLNFVGAFETFTEAVRDSVVAVGQPLLDSAIWRNQKYLAVQTALQAAWPQAVIDVANGFLTAGNGVVVAVIDGTQDFVAAVLTFDLGNIVDAAVDGTRNFFVSLGDGAGAIIGGIEAAQFGIATALAAEPPATAVTDVAADTAVMSSPPVDSIPSLSGPPRSFTLDTVRPIEKLRTTVVDAVDTVIKDVSQAVHPAAPEGVIGDLEPVQTPAVTTLSDDDSDSGAAVVTPPKKRVGATPVKDTVKKVEQTVKKVTDRVTVGVTKDLGVKREFGVRKGTGAAGGADTDTDTKTEPKPASDE